MIAARIEGREAIFTIMHPDGLHEEALRAAGAREVEPLDAPLEDLFIDYSSPGTKDCTALRR